MCFPYLFLAQMERDITRPASVVQEEELDSTAGNGTYQEDDLEYGEVQADRDKNPTASRHQFRHASAHFCRTGVTTSLGSIALVALVSPPTHALWWTRRSGRRIRHRGTWKARILERYVFGGRRPGWSNILRSEMLPPPSSGSARSLYQMTPMMLLGGLSSVTMHLVYRTSQDTTKQQEQLPGW